MIKRLLCIALLLALPLSAVASSQDLQRFSLANGLEVLILPDHTLPIVSLGFYIPGGVVAQEVDNSAAHITYTLLSEGTHSYSKQDIHAAEDRGGSIETFARQRTGVIRATVHRDDAQTSLSALISMHQEPLLPAQRLDVVKNQTQAAIANRQAVAARHAAYLFQQSLYQSTPLAFATQGQSDLTAQLTREQVQAYHQQAIRITDGTVFVAAGDVDESLVEHITARLEQLPARQLEGVEPFSTFADNSPLDEKHSASTQQAHVFLRYPAPPADDHCFAPMHIASTALGGGMGSRLFRELREEQGLAYSVSASMGVTVANPGMRVSIGTAPGNITEALSGMERQVKRLFREQLTENELERARNYLLGNHLLSRETVGDRVLHQAIHTLMGLSHSYDEDSIKALEEVDLNQIQDCARQWLADAKPDRFVYGEPSE
ncbi:M16 family metallopeptidase [Desulfurispira natronophila]|uniref:Putative Zn-dependent peptidase n=1 Tax=Desulfurispira natronophila TaxID=682562 RepID=A0A7W7Y580_9BACT|nr:pitrilysin family protein [Desulfurispira natronophila]MBB5022134.1 putative Zn-dependent peptidase [Desulfurispira natronophila]